MEVNEIQWKVKCRHSCELNVKPTTAENQVFMFSLWNSEFVSFAESCDRTESKNYQIMFRRQTNMAAGERRHKSLSILGTVSFCKLAITSLWRQKQFIGQNFFFIFSWSQGNQTIGHSWNHTGHSLDNNCPDYGQLLNQKHV